MPYRRAYRISLTFHCLLRRDHSLHGWQTPGSRFHILTILLLLKGDLATSLDRVSATHVSRSSVREPKSCWTTIWAKIWQTLNVSVKSPWWFFFSKGKRSGPLFRFSYDILQCPTNILLTKSCNCSRQTTSFSEEGRPRLRKVFQERSHYSFLQAQTPLNPT